MCNNSLSIKCLPNSSKHLSIECPKFKTWWAIFEFSLASFISHSWNSILIILLCLLAPMPMYFLYIPRCPNSAEPEVKLSILALAVLPSPLNRTQSPDNQLSSSGFVSEVIFNFNVKYKESSLHWCRIKLLPAGLAVIEHLEDTSQANGYSSAEIKKTLD